MGKIEVPLLENPIIIREFRRRMRGPRAFILLTIYLLVLGGIAYAVYRVIASSSGYVGGGVSQSATIGQALFIALAVLEMAGVCLITPSLTAGTISSEYERRTYDVLMAAPLRPLAIVWGKMIPALSYILLLILAAIPMFNVVFLFGGVTISDILRTLLLLALTTVTMGSIGLFFSALTRRTGRAAFASYTVVVLLIVGTFAGWVAWMAIASGSGSMAAAEDIAYRSMLYLNPFAALLSATIAGDSLKVTIGSISHPFWHYTVCVYLVVAAVLCLLTSHLVRPIYRWRFSRETAIGLAIVGAMVVASYLLVFSSTVGAR